MWVAALSGLLVAVVLALVVFRMPGPMVAASAAHGVVFGLVRIAWIIVASLFLYQVAVETGQFQVMKESIAALSTDKRIQLILVAFCFVRVSRGDRRRRCAGGDRWLIPDRARIRALSSRHAMLARQYRAGGLGRSGYANSSSLRSDWFLRTGIERNDRADTPAHLGNPTPLAGAKHGRLAADSRGMAGAACQRAVVRGHPVLLVELPGLRISRHHRSRSLAVDDGFLPQNLAAEELPGNEGNSGISTRTIGRSRGTGHADQAPLNLRRAQRLVSISARFAFHLPVGEAGS